jgi:rfaE bifunctional protein kinase chain/domain
VGRIGTRRLAELVGRFPRVRVLVIGDLMLDQFIWGQVSRISPEAPVPVVRVTAEEFRAGGAGNVISNICALGGRAVACGVVGRDASGRQLLDALRAGGAGIDGVVAARTAVTTRKVRIIAHQQQVVRIDRETSEALDGRVVARVRRYALDHLERFAAVVVSDYGKGVVGGPLLEALAERRARRPFLWLIDPKRGNFARYRGASLVKPNAAEASAASGIEITDRRSLRAAGRRLLDVWETEAVLISRGEEGMSLFKRSGEVRHFPTGAGDTVLAACALALAAGGTLEEAAVLANVAAGIAVAHVGTVAVTARDLRAAVRRGGGLGDA